MNPDYIYYSSPPIGQPPSEQTEITCLVRPHLLCTIISVRSGTPLMKDHTRPQTLFRTGGLITRGIL